jgi:type II secretion system protein C
MSEMVNGSTALRVLAVLRWLAVVTACACAGLYTFLYRVLPTPTAAAADAVPAPSWPEEPPIPADAWSVFRGAVSPVHVSDSPLAQRYRLAGTFFLFGGGQEEGAGGGRRAIIDELSTQRQHLVSEGERVEDLEVVRVFPDHVLLRGQGLEAELWLSFSDPGLTATAAGGAAPAGGEPPPLETNRFGKRVGETRWVLSREALMEYYREILDEPERIAALYMSLKPDYKEERIAGYILDEEGEGDFFHAVGLRQGDVIRKVNSINMTSQKRAEYFLGEFVKNRMNALVIDVERSGRPEKLIYFVR